ncbi:MAG: hypothetical protein LUC45_01240 [Paraprevotella sp.]|nr:hypothetical protein [Paraprevotella sp.]
MEQILADYLDICLRFRKKYLSKPERKPRHILLMKWANTPYVDGNLTIPDLYKFWDCNRDISYNKVFVGKVIVPAVRDDRKNGSIEGLKFLFYCLRGRDSFSYRSSDNPLSIYCDADGYEYSPLELADMVLEKEPEDEDVLKVKYFIGKEILWYSIHEIPSGILSGGDGASIPDMLNSVDRFQNLSDKLKIDDDEILISDCRQFYVAYGAYL